MKKVLFAIASIMFISGAAYADISKTGVIQFHTGWGCDYFTTPGANDTAVGGVSCQGFTFSSDGSGLLHEGIAGCYGAFDINGDMDGKCSWSDSDGDHIYTNFKGNAGTNEGTNYITGGTGKYAGITGQGPWACKGAPGGESMCNQSLTYKMN